MTVSGLSVIPSRCCLQMPVYLPGLQGRQAPFSAGFKPKGIQQLPRLERYNTQTQLIRCAMGASYGSKENDPNADSGSSDVFPRINVEDPYRRLGVRRDASEKELNSAMNFLMEKYAGHQPSLSAIESAHTQIVWQKFYESKHRKFDLLKKWDLNLNKLIQAVESRFRTPSTEFTIKTSIAFLVIGVLTALFPTDDGPTFQVAVSFFTTIYFIHDRLKKKVRALLYGVASFVVAWLLPILMVSVIPRFPMFKGAYGLELTCSLISYVFLWVSATYLN